MSTGDSPADGRGLGAYGRRSWLSDDEEAEERGPAAPFNPFASPAAPGAPDPPPLATIEPDAPPTRSRPASPGTAPRAEPVPPSPFAAPPAAQAHEPTAPVAPGALPVEDVVDHRQPAAPWEAGAEVSERHGATEPDLTTDPVTVAEPVAATLPPPPALTPGGRPGMRLVASGRPSERRPEPQDTEPSPMPPDGPLHSGADRPDLSEYTPASARRSRRGPRWAGRRPYADGGSSGEATRWTPATVVPAPSGSAASGSAAGERVVSQGPWRVVDTGTSLEVSGPGSVSLRWLAPMIYAIPAFVLLVVLGVYKVSVVFISLCFFVAFLNGLLSAGWGRPFLRVDEQGMHVRRAGLRRHMQVIPWNHVAGLRTRTQPMTWPRPEFWYIQTTAGKQVRVWAVSTRPALNGYPSLRRIMIGVACFPLRYGWHAMPVDGIPGPAPHGHLPPPPDAELPDGRE